MSAKIMGLVWDSALDREKKYILLALADHADHDGEDIYPSIPKIAWKTDYSERQVQRVVKELIQEKILILDGESHLGTRRYKIDLDALPKRSKYQPVRRGRPPKMGDILSGNFEEAEIKTGDISAEMGDISAEMGDIAMSPEPSFKPSENPSSQKAAEESAGLEMPAAASGDSEALLSNLRALKAAGIAENPRTRALAALPHVTPEFIQAHAARYARDHPGRPLGLLVAKLEANDPAPPQLMRWESTPAEPEEPDLADPPPDDPDLQAVWGQALRAMEAHLGTLGWRAYRDRLKAARLVSRTGPAFQVAVRDEYERAWLESRARAALEQRLTGILNRPARIEFVILAAT